MQRLEVYNLSGESQTWSGYVFPVGGPFVVMQDDSATDPVMLIKPGGTLETIDPRPDMFGSFEQGMILGFAVMSLVMAIYYLKLLRRAPGSS